MHQQVRLIQIGLNSQQLSLVVALVEDATTALIELLIVSIGIINVILSTLRVFVVVTSH